MKVFTCSDAKGHWPVGFGAVVVAQDEESARKILNVDLINEGLKPDDFTLQEISLELPQARILVNGDY